MIEDLTFFNKILCDIILSNFEREIGDNGVVDHLFPYRTQKLSTTALTIVLTSENKSLPTPFY
jgi:hypothetical protein